MDFIQIKNLQMVAPIDQIYGVCYTEPITIDDQNPDIENIYNIIRRWEGYVNPIVDGELD